MSTLSRAAASLATTAVVLALAPGAVADDVYHSEHMPLTPVGTAPLRTGFVENIHADGPRVYAQEVYVLNGALPDADFEVHLLAYPFDPACAGTAVGFRFTTLTTNGAATDEPSGSSGRPTSPLRSAAQHMGSAGRSVPAASRCTRRLALPSRSTEQDRRDRRRVQRRGAEPATASGTADALQTTRRSTSRAADTPR